MSIESFPLSLKSLAGKNLCVWSGRNRPKSKQPVRKGYNPCGVMEKFIYHSSQRLNQQLLVYLLLQLYLLARRDAKGVGGGRTSGR